MFRCRTIERGFTLLELLVVLFLISLAVGIAATRFSAGTESAELKTEARKLVALMRQTRARAVAESLSLGIAATPDAPGYRLLPENRDIALPGELHLNIAPHSRDIAFPESGIFFYPDGSSNGGILTLTGNSGSWRLEVDWLTGEVAIVDE